MDTISRDESRGHGSGVQRRGMLKQASALLGGGAALAQFLSRTAEAAPNDPRDQAIQAASDRAGRGMPAPRITDISVITYPAGGFGTFTVVKVTTDQPGLYGYGEATIEARAKLLKVMVSEYLKPLLMGRETDRIEQIWQLCYLSSYYKNDQVQNAAISGVCDALWDIKGRQAGMPVYQLVGGKARDACEYYGGAGWSDNNDPGKGLVESAKRQLSEGIRNFRVSVFMRQGGVKGLDGKESFDRDLAIRRLLKAFEAFRKEMPADVRLACDMHSMFDGPRAVQFCKDCEQFQPILYMEDPIPPEEAEHLRFIRQQTAVPLAFGELWNNPNEWRPVIENRLTDYIRNHVSHIGGFTAARKVAMFAENFEVRTSWHAASVSPVGHMANLTLEVTSANFGIHEHMGYSEPMKEVFQGALEVKNGYAWVSEKPGWGIEIDEAAAAKATLGEESVRENRLPDGSEILGGR